MSFQCKHYETIGYWVPNITKFIYTVRRHRWFGDQTSNAKPREAEHTVSSIGPHLCLGVWKQSMPIDVYEKLFRSVGLATSVVVQSAKIRCAAPRPTGYRNRVPSQLFAINRRQRQSLRRSHILIMINARMWRLTGSRHHQTASVQKTGMTGNWTNRHAWNWGPLNSQYFGSQKIKYRTRCARERTKTLLSLTRRGTSPTLTHSPDSSNFIPIAIICSVLLLEVPQFNHPQKLVR